MSENTYGMASLSDWLGKELGTSKWVTVDQQRINEFAHCTGDHQWIHVDVERAKKESPFGGPVAHGYLTLALLAESSMDDRRGSEGRRGGVQLRHGQGALPGAGEGRGTRPQSHHAR